MSKSKVLDGKSQTSFNCPTFRQLATFRAEQCRRPAWQKGRPTVGRSCL